MSNSEERITSFAPSVTHRVELRSFIVRKMPKSMHVWPYTIRKEIRLLPQKDNPVNYQIIGNGSPLVSHQGYQPCFKAPPRFYLAAVEKDQGKAWY